MNIQSPKPGEICLIGEAALRVLPFDGQATVLASVTNAVYLQTQPGELCWLIPMQAPMHQRGLKITGQLPRLRSGDKVRVSGHTLEFNSEGRFDFHQSMVWREPINSSAGIVPLSWLPGTVELIAGRLLATHHPTGLGCLLSTILEITAGQQKPLPVRSASFESPVARVAWTEVAGMLQASLLKDSSLFIQHAKSLVGLGEGLTPSGDDFLGGFFYAMRLLQEHYSADINLPLCNYSDFMMQSKPLTSLLSYTILFDQADGHSLEPLHLLGNGLLSAAPPDELISHAEKLISVGHSTGWDILAGFFAGMWVITVQ